MKGFTAVQKDEAKSLTIKTLNDELMSKVVSSLTGITPERATEVSKAFISIGRDNMTYGAHLSEEDSVKITMITNSYQDLSPEEYLDAVIRDIDATGLMTGKEWMAEFTSCFDKLAKITAKFPELNSLTKFVDDIKDTFLDPVNAQFVAAEVN